MYQLQGLCLPVSVMQGRGQGARWRPGRGRGAEGHQALQGTRGRSREQRGRGGRRAAFPSVRRPRRSDLPDDELRLVVVVRAAVAQVRDLQVRVRLRVLLQPCSPLRGGLPARPDGAQAQARPGPRGMGLRPLPLPRGRPAANVRPTHRQAAGVRRQDEPDGLTPRRAVRPPGLPRCSPLAPARLPCGEQGGEGVRQLGKAALQRVGVKLGGVERARGQFGAVVEGEGPWEVGVEAPGVVEGRVAGVRAQQ